MARGPARARHGGPGGGSRRGSDGAEGVPIVPATRGPLPARACDPPIVRNALHKLTHAPAQIFPQAHAHKLTPAQGRRHRRQQHRWGQRSSDIAIAVDVPGDDGDFNNNNFDINNNININPNHQVR